MATKARMFYWRQGLRAFALSTVACLITLPAGETWAIQEEPVRLLRLITVNLLHGGPMSGFVEDDTHLGVRLEMIIRELKTLNPDILALQEVSNSRWHGDVAERIASALGFHVVFAPATNRIFHFWPLDQLIVGIMGFKEGSAILSRFPIIGSDIYDLPRCQRRLEPRILLGAHLATPWGPLDTFSTHMTRDDECQMERVGEIVRKQRQAGPSVLMGDFNTPENSKVLAKLQDKADFVDVFRSANPDIPGPTVWQRIEVEQPTASRRVDFIFLLGGREMTATVRSSRVVLNHPGHLPDGRTLWPSDHYGVFAEIEIVPSSAARTAERDETPPYPVKLLSKPHTQVEPRHDVRVEINITSTRADGFSKSSEIEKKVRCDGELLGHGIVQADSDGDQE